MSPGTDYNKTDRRLIYIAIIGILIFLWLLLFDTGTGRRDRTNDVAIGRVAKIKNDSRQKEKGSYNWYDLDTEDRIYIGDSVYSGKDSGTSVELVTGGRVDVGENSLVTFDQIGSQNVLDLASGKFRLKVNGSMQVAVQGELMTINSSKAELEIGVEKNKKPNIKVLSGNPQIIRSATPINFTSNNKEKNLKYTWHLYDEFIKIGDELHAREKKPDFVTIPNHLSWQDIANSPAKVEWSQFSNFKTRVSFQSKAEGLNLNKAFVGDNFWRISFDGKKWSNSRKFTLEAKHLDQAAPRIPFPNYEAPFLSERISLSVPLVTPIETSGFVVQASLSATFDQSRTKTFWSPTSDVRLSFYRPGVYYYRFKTVNRSQETSDWSNTMSFNIFRPESPPAPFMAKDTIEGLVGDRITVSWRTENQRSRFELFDSQNNKIKRAKGNRFSWIPTEPGEFKARAYQVNKYGLESPASKFVKIIIRPKPVVVAKEEPQREPAQDNKTKAKLEKPKDYRFNESYKKSQFSVQGMLWTIQSTDQKLNDTSPPYSTGLGLHTLLWNKQHGFEGTFKTGVFGLNETGRESTSLKSVEPRYHYRFMSRVPFSMIREIMYSVFTGFEMYRNGADNISSQYDLLKFGTSIEFPYRTKWSSGGELVFGYGLESSKKFEISGNFNYFFDPEFSLGFGYRLHLFDAASSEASPSGLLPYREGYTEGFSILKYYF